MNVLFCADGKIARRGGVSNYVQLLFAYFDRERVVPYDWNLWTGYTFIRIIQPGFAIAIYRKFKVAWTLITFPRLIRKGKIDIVHLNPSLVPRAIQRDIAFAQRCIEIGVPFVVFFRGWDKNFEAKLESNPKKLNRLVISLGGASKVIVLASEFKEKLVEWGVEEEKIVIETTAVDDRSLSGLNIGKNIESTSSDDRFNILFLARIEKAKGVYEAVDAFRILKQKHPYISMEIAGDGAELPNLKRYVIRHNVDGIKFLGWLDQEDKRKAYLDASVYLFPTWGEGMPNSVLEAMAFGLPVVTRPVGGLADFFEDGKMGYITTSRDPEVLASMCENLIENPVLRTEIALHNSKYACRRFLASQVASRIEQIYGSIAKRPESICN